MKTQAYYDKHLSSKVDRMHNALAANPDGMERRWLVIMLRALESRIPAYSPERVR